MIYGASRRAVLVVYAVIITVPLIVVLAGSLKTMQGLFDSPFGIPTNPQWGNYSKVLQDQDLGRAFVNSTVVTVSSVVVTLVLCSMFSYAIARIPGWRGHAIFGFVVIGMAVPVQANMIPQYVLFNQLGLLDSLLGLVIINIVATAPVAVFILAGFMKTLPRELFEAAAIDGTGPWRTYRSIVVPLSAPSLSATAIFLCVMHWNELLYPLLFISDPAKRTLPLALLNFRGEFLTDYPLLFSGIVVASAPIVLAYVFLQRYFVTGLTAGSVKA